MGDLGRSVASDIIQRKPKKNSGKGKSPRVLKVMQARRGRDKQDLRFYDRKVEGETFKRAQKKAPKAWGGA